MGRGTDWEVEKWEEGKLLDEKAQLGWKNVKRGDQEVGRWEDGKKGRLYIR